jgi:4-hydroxy-3-polyprenylbenzoate decarboxylase
LALGYKRNEPGARIAELAKGHVKPDVIATAPCKQAILTADDVDLTRLPLFLDHERDGLSYTSDNLVVTKDRDTNAIDWGVYQVDVPHEE